MQALESKLQRQSTTRDEAMEEEQEGELEMELSDLRVQLADVKAEKEVLIKKIESFQEHQSEKDEWTAALKNNMASVSC